MRILVIGGAGHLGRLIVPALAEMHSVTVADRVGGPVPDGVATVLIDVLDQDRLAEVSKDMDLVLYMAMGTKEGWGTPVWARSQFDVNVTGLYNAVQASARSGVPRVLVAGSMSVFERFLEAEDETVPDAFDAYGLSKRLGEEVCAAACVEHGLDVTVLRLVLPLSDAEWRDALDDKHADVMTSASDTAAAFLAAIATPIPGFTTLTVTGDHERRHLDWSRTQRLLGWSPRSRRHPPASVAKGDSDH